MGRKNQGWHLLQESALFGYFAFATNQNNHGKSIHFSGQPLYSQVIKMLHFPARVQPL